MTSLEVTSTDAFLDMPQSSQLLYFHLNSLADDDGFVANPRSIMRNCGAQADDLKLLIAKKFVIAFDEGVCVLKHWRINNFIRKDIYKETKYTELKRTLFIRPNGAYTLTDDGRAIPIPDGHFNLEDVNDMVTTRQLSIGKDSIGKVRKGKDSLGKNDKLIYGEFENVFLSLEEYDKLIEKLGESNTKLLIEELSGYMASKKTKYSSHYATLLNWSRRKNEIKNQNKPKALQVNDKYKKYENNN